MRWERGLWGLESGCGITVTGYGVLHLKKAFVLGVARLKGHQWSVSKSVSGSLE